MTIGKIALGVLIGNLAFALIVGFVLSVMADNASFYAVSAALGH